MQRFYEQRVKEYLENIIKLEKYPRTVTTVVLVVNNEDGSLLSALFNCAMMALLLNGLALKETAWSFDISVLQKENQRTVLFYPSKAEEKVKKFFFLVYFLRRRIIV